jgi:hypothetical protein
MIQRVRHQAAWRPPTGRRRRGRVDRGSRGPSGILRIPLVPVVPLVAAALLPLCLGATGLLTRPSTSSPRPCARRPWRRCISRRTRHRIPLSLSTFFWCLLSISVGSVTLVARRPSAVRAPSCGRRSASAQTLDVRTLSTLRGELTKLDLGHVGNGCLRRTSPSHHGRPVSGGPPAEPRLGLNSRTAHQQADHPVRRIARVPVRH